MRSIFFAATLVACVTGCAGAGIQQSSETDLDGSSKIVLPDRDGNVDGHKRPFAREYIVAPGSHTVGVCTGGALCEKYYYIKFDTKPGLTYTVHEQVENVSVTNRLGYLIDTRGYGLDLRDGVPAAISFKDVNGSGH
ncbi:hypothetical protein [Paraburkholderia sp. J8-2]|uniref:hypothetical protein n=1 Tax=Paraburkholderia sp. J8-2 TaxID=2805440 RepID=UPI002AB73B20|nr:hypothetical protein [Paraburkholderia sp. J8-2]